MKSDFVILEEVKKGNAQAFGELVLRHKKVILRMAMRMTRDMEAAEDIVQESFLKAFRKIHLFEARSSFKSWLYQIALNTARNKMRSRRYDHVNVDNVQLLVHSKAERKTFQSDLRIMLKEEIDRLPPKQKMALTLRVFDDLSFKEIADVMSCPYDTAKANYRHAIMKLRHRFETAKEYDGLEEFNFFTAPEMGSFATEVE